MAHNDEISCSHLKRCINTYNTVRYSWYCWLKKLQNSTYNLIPCKKCINAQKSLEDHIAKLQWFSLDGKVVGNFLNYIFKTWLWLIIKALIILKKVSFKVRIRSELSNLRHRDVHVSQILLSQLSGCLTLVTSEKALHWVEMSFLGPKAPCA